MGRLFGLKFPDQARLCSLHFEESDYTISTNNLKRLLPDVVPSIYNTTLEPEVKKSKLCNTPKKATKDILIESTTLRRSPQQISSPRRSPQQISSPRRTPQQISSPRRTPLHTLGSPLYTSTTRRSPLQLIENRTESIQLFPKKRLFQQVLIEKSDIFLSPPSFKRIKANVDLKFSTESPKLQNILKDIKSAHYEDNQSNCKQNFQDDLLEESWSAYSIPFEKELETNVNHNINRRQFQDKKIQVSVERRKVSSKKISLSTRKQGRLISKLKKKLEKVKEQVATLRTRILDLKMKTTINDCNLLPPLAKLKTACADENLKACFLIEQLKSFGKNIKNFVHSTLKICVMWNQKSPSAYRYIRDLGVLKLPHPKTLKRYLGSTTGESGVTSLVKCRLKHEFNQLTDEHGKVGSLVIDEMAIKTQYL